MTPRLTIVIPTRSNPRIRRLLIELYDQVLPGDRIVVGDNGLTDPLPEADPRVPVLRIPIAEPFVFATAINTCLTYRHPLSDLLLLNDDVHTIAGSLRDWRDALRRRVPVDYGLVSPAIEGVAGNPAQQIDTPDLAPTDRPLCFMAVWIRRQAYEQIGRLDERFVDYGFEDADYCKRAVLLTWRLGVLGGWTLSHQGSATYRERYPDAVWASAGQRAWKVYEEKWGPGSATEALG